MVTAAAAYAVAAGTPDPELPLLTVADLGILRAVEVTADAVCIVITPTYSGCPAMHEISADIRRRLARAGVARVTVETRLSPAWTSDWITPDGRRKLREAGIAPPSPTSFALLTPGKRRGGPVPLTLGPPAPVPCPRCGSSRTRRTAGFGATACKSLHRCDACDEPFEAVKPL